MSLIVVEAIRGPCASFMILTETVSEIFCGQTNSSILVGKGSQYGPLFTKTVILFVFIQHMAKIGSISIANSNVDIILANGNSWN